MAPRAVNVATGGKVKFRFLLRDIIEAITHVRCRRSIMRKMSAATFVTILAIAVYFALAWGILAADALMSSNFGLEDVWGAQLVFEIGRVFRMGPTDLIKVAAFLAAVKFVAAGVCALHVLDRARGRMRNELMEGALIIVLTVSAISSVSAMWSHNTELLREQALQFAIAGVGIALCMVERALERDKA